MEKETKENEEYFFKRLLFTAEMFMVFAKDLSHFAQKKLEEIEEEIEFIKSE